MSAEGFTKHGYRGALLCEEPLPHYYKEVLKIRVFDIGADDMFGAWYPDNARIAVPRVWFPRAQRAYEKLKAEGKIYPPTFDGSPPDAIVTERVKLKPRGPQSRTEQASSPPSSSSKQEPVSVAGPRIKLTPRGVR